MTKKTLGLLWRKFFSVKMNKYIIIFISLTFIQQTNAANSKKLSGKPLGSASAIESETQQSNWWMMGGSTSTTTYTESKTENQPKNAFDNDFKTYNESYSESYGYVGMDLGSPHIITKIAYAPCQKMHDKMLMGVFEGANRADFIDAIPIYIITENPDENVMTTVSVNCSKGFRYIRYVSPNGQHCLVSELAFYGYKGKGDNSHITTFSGLPVINIHTEGCEDIIMDKNVYHKGLVSIVSADGTSIILDSMKVKGRGNGSWYFDKKPYKIRLKNKERLLDLPAKAKDWTLIANYCDKTLMRDLIAFEVSKRFKMRYTPSARPVDVFYNGEFKGNFQLSDQIEIGKQRANIKKMNPADTCMPKLSGGYLIEIDAYAMGEKNSFTSSKFGTAVTIHSPKEGKIKKQQFNYIKAKFDTLEARMVSPYFADKEKGYRSCLDVNSFIDFMLINELCGNTDGFWSVYMTLDRDSSKFYTGPVWDFDLGFNNDYRIFPLEDKTDLIFRSNGDNAPGMLDFGNALLKDSTFIAEMRQHWSVARDNYNINTNSLVAFVDSLQNALQRSQRLNFMRWQMIGLNVQANPRSAGNYDGEVEYVRDYIKKRIPWMDRFFKYDKKN